MSKEKQIYFLDLEDIRTESLVEKYIYTNYELNYYWSNDFSCDFYIELASLGFISISSNVDNKFILLAEMQFDYAVLDFKNLHISKKVKKLLNTTDYDFKINNNFEIVLDKIESYHQNSWCEKEYKELLLNLISFKHNNINFKLECFELYKDNILVACEIGYTIGKTYTSLSGYTNKAYKNYGTLQLVLLSKYLENKNYHFWNLGHSAMQYKINLGAQILNRNDFLKRWLISSKK